MVAPELPSLSSGSLPSSDRFDRAAKRKRSRDFHPTHTPKLPLTCILTSYPSYVTPPGVTPEHPLR